MLRGFTTGTLATMILVAGTQGRPYAPKPRIPDGPATDPVLQMEIASVRSAEIPPRSAVDIPPYPRALAIRATALRSRSNQGRDTIVRYPVIVLVTTDPAPDVVDFYRRHLDGWSNERLLDAHFFWNEEDEEFDPLGEAALTSQMVQVRDARAVRLVPEARTEIHVRYRPRRRIIEFDGGGGDRSGI